MLIFLLLLSLNLRLIQSGGNFKIHSIDKTNSTNPNVLEILSVTHTTSAFNLTAMIRKPLNYVLVSNVLLSKTCFKFYEQQIYNLYSNAP